MALSSLNCSQTLHISSTTRVFRTPRWSPRALQWRQRHLAPLPRQCRIVQAASSSSSAAGDGPLTPQAKLDALDLNQLQTALNAAIASENYALAAKIRDVLTLILGPEAAAATAADWHRLGILDWLADRTEDLGFRMPTEVQRRSALVIADRKDCVIEAETGSGKSLSFLLPVLSLLSYPPAVPSEHLKGPAAVVVVPTRELGVQLVMTVYKLFGGSVNPGIPGERSNLFRFHGPQGLKVRGLLLPEEVELAVREGYLDGVHVVVGTPELLAQSLHRGVEDVQHCQAIVVDEVDACCAEAPGDMALIMTAAVEGYSTNSPAAVDASGGSSSQRQRPTVVLVGATIDEELVETAVQDGWLQDPVRVRVGAKMKVPKGLRHRFIVVPGTTAKVGAMCRQLREDLRSSSDDAAPARVMVFADGEVEARALADPLRTVLWGEHAISVLLPSGVEPIKALHSFRDNQTSLLLATPAAARGLDLPSVSHVYNLSPPGDAAEYLHRAGRAGRIGSPVRGIVTTLVTPEEVPALVAIGGALGIAFEEKEAPPAPALTGEGEDVGDVEEAKRSLEAMLAFSPRDDKNGGGNGSELKWSSGEWEE